MSDDHYAPPPRYRAQIWDFTRLHEELGALHKAVVSRRIELPDSSYIADLLELLHIKIPASATDVNASGERRLYEKIVETHRQFFTALRLQTIPVVTVPWLFLPPGEIGNQQLRQYLHDFAARNPALKVDFERIEFALKLHPERLVVGEKGNDFDGYVAFVYLHAKRVLLDNPVEGNAAYIFGDDWERLSKIPKSDLLNHHKSEFVRVIHTNSGNWKWKIQSLVAPA